MSEQGTINISIPADMGLTKDEAMRLLDTGYIAKQVYDEIWDLVRPDPESWDYPDQITRYVREAIKPRNLPKIVCLCGSTRFSEAYQQANLRETLAGNIVLTIGCNMRADGDLFASMTDDERDEVKRKLDELHLRKIDLADEILVLNVNGYVGESTLREIAYASDKGKEIRWLESPQ